MLISRIHVHWQANTLGLSFSSHMHLSTLNSRTASNSIFGKQAVFWLNWLIPGPHRWHKHSCSTKWAGNWLGKSRNTVFDGQFNALISMETRHCWARIWGKSRATMGILLMSVWLLIRSSLNFVSWDLLALLAERMQLVWSKFWDFAVSRPAKTAEKRMTICKLSILNI